MKHVLAVYANKAYNLDSKQEEYTTKIIVSQDVIDFLDIHDIEMTSKGERLYIMNNMKYIYLGIDMDSFISLNKIQQETLKKYQYMYEIITNKIEELIKKEMNHE